MKDNNYPTNDDLRNSDVSALNAMSRPKEEDPADVGAPREFPPEPAFETGTRVRIQEVIDHTRSACNGMVGTIESQIETKQEIEEYAYRVVLSNGYSNLFFHSELEIIPFFELEVTQFGGTVKIEVAGTEEDGFDYCLLDEDGNGLGGQMHFSSSDNAIHSARRDARLYLARTFGERRMETFAELDL